MNQAGWRFGVVCALGAFALDQGTKALVLSFASALSPGVEVLPILNLIFTRNLGVSFGLFGMVQWWLTLPGLVVVTVLAVWLRKSPNLSLCSLQDR